MTSVSGDEQWLEEWYGEPWRKPDKFEKFGNHFQAVWYSEGSWRDHTKKDYDNSRFAYMVEMSPTAFIITEYTHSSEWECDLPDDLCEPPHWKMQGVEFEPADIYKLILGALRDPTTEASRKAASSGTPAGRVRIPRGQPELIARYAMGIGQACIGYGGGDYKDVSESLP